MALDWHRGEAAGTSLTLRTISESSVSLWLIRSENSVSLWLVIDGAFDDEAKGERRAA